MTSRRFVPNGSPHLLDRLLGRLSAVALVAALVGCAPDGPVAGAPDTGRLDASVDSAMDSGVVCPTTIADLQAQILTPSCATAGCHTTSNPAVGLDLQSPGVASRLVGVAAVSCPGHTLVVAGDPASSFLIDKVSNDLPACGSRMPLGGVLDPASVACLSAWIASLAPMDAGVDAAMPGIDVGPDASGCPSTLSECGGACLDLASDPSHCGACTTDCGSGGFCSGASCGCMSGLMACGGTCTDTQGDAMHCGSCTTACRAGQICANGTCMIGHFCPAGTMLCGGANCYDLMTDPLHCGSCANACPAGLACTGGSCGCGAGQTDCGGSCVDTTTSPLDCGGCGIACGPGEVCSGGSCGCSAPGMICGGTCVDTDTDATNCGSCGNVCAAGQGCSGGTCGCSATQMSCGGVCIDTSSDPANCGSCGHACASGEMCSAGTCTGCGPSSTLSGQVQPILTANCATAGCHAGVRPAQGLNLSAGMSFGQLVGVRSAECADGRLRVEARRADRSYLVNKITGTGICSGGMMPVTGPALSASDVALIESWICQGALND